MMLTFRYYTIYTTSHCLYRLYPILYTLHHTALSFIFLTTSFTDIYISLLPSLCNHTHPRGRWISFHSSYDFGYLLKTLTCSELPMDEAQFLELLMTYFPCIYDVKYMMTAVEGLHGGLSSLAEMLQIDRIGPMHQAGSDSLLTAQVLSIYYLPIYLSIYLSTYLPIYLSTQTFFGLITKHLSGNCDDSKFKGELFGLGTNHTKYKSKGYSIQGAGGSTNSINSSGGSNTNNNAPTLQYNSSVHYGTNNHSIPNGSIHQGSSNNFGYGDDGVM